MNLKWSNNATFGTVAGGLILAGILSQTVRTLAAAAIASGCTWLRNGAVPAWLCAAVLLAAGISLAVLVRDLRRRTHERNETRNDLSDCAKQRVELGQQLALRQRQQPALRVDVNHPTAFWSIGSVYDELVVTVFLSAMFTYTNPSKPDGAVMKITRVDVVGARRTMVLLNPFLLLNNRTTEMQNGSFTFMPDGELPPGELTLGTVFMDSENFEYKVKLGPLRFAGDATQPPAAPHAKTPDNPLKIELIPSKSWWSPFVHNGQDTMLVRLRGTLIQTGSPYLPRVTTMMLEGTRLLESPPGGLPQGLPNGSGQIGKRFPINLRLILSPCIATPEHTYNGSLVIVDHNGTRWPFGIELRYALHYNLVDE